MPRPGRLSIAAPPRTGATTQLGSFGRALRLVAALGLGVVGQVGCGGIPLPDRIPVDRAEGLDPLLAGAVESIARAFVDDQRMPGLGVALVDGGEVAYVGAFGWADIAAERPLEVHTPMLIASVSKTLVGIAAMQGVEAGRLSLGDSVAERVGFAVDNPYTDGERITLYDLLTHHSAIRDSGAYDASYGPGDPEIALGTFCEGYVTQGGAHWRPRNYARRMPGERFAYSNVGIALAAEAVAAGAGLSFSDLVAQDVLDPLGMVDSAYFLADLPAPPAVPYERSGRRFRALRQYGFPTYPDGLMRSSAADLGSYLAAMARGGALDGERVLSEASVASLWAVDPDLQTDAGGQAVVWYRRRLARRSLIGHDGGDDGAAAELWIDPATGDGYALVANADPRSWEAWVDLERALLAVME